MKIPIPVRTENFTCPVCKKKDDVIAELEMSSGGDMGGIAHSRVTGYRCGGCTTRFQNVKMFSSSKPVSVAPINFPFGGGPSTMIAPGQ